MVISGAIFDLDGVVIDSEPIKKLAHDHTASYFGAKLPADFYERHIGASQFSVAEAAISEGNMQISESVYNGRFSEEYLALQPPEIQPVRGFVDFVRLIRDRPCKVALVTSSPTRICMPAIRKLGHHFTTIITGDHVARHKPHPDAYLLALREMETSPHQTVVFEDTDAGVVAASRAGLAVIGCRHSLNMRQIFESTIMEINAFYPAREIYSSLLQLADAEVKQDKQEGSR